VDEEVEAVRAAVPLAREPDRSWRIDGPGCELAIWEWGDEAAPLVLFAHGGFDFARTLDVFAPMLADTGRRVVSWDLRGHGDSGHTELYSWEVDVRDAVAVFDAVAGGRPIDVIGHSKGGNLMLQLAEAQPHRFRRLVNLDGIPWRVQAPDVSERDRTRLLAGEIEEWLRHRRRLGPDHRRFAGPLEEVARRRAEMNPRLTIEWLRYLVTVGGRRDADGWRWKIDPALRLGGFGPRRPEWALRSLNGLGMPFLGVLGTEVERMGWGARAADVAEEMPVDGEVVELDGVGHFIHIEQPERVTALVHEFLER
jgi:pimeloyl-ACP methyl ester carboxylesterase